MSTYGHCHDCGNSFLLEYGGKDKLCCMCWYSALVFYEAQEETFQALVNEVMEFMEGMESDFERITLMQDELEKECSFAYKSGGCDLCAWEESCQGSDNMIYTLPK